jgi:hypothetical protein
MVRWSLIAADALLALLALLLVLQSRGHLGIASVSLCVGALGLGAWLACLALERK